MFNLIKILKTKKVYLLVLVTLVFLLISGGAVYSLNKQSGPETNNPNQLIVSDSKEKPEDGEVAGAQEGASLTETNELIITNVPNSTATPTLKTPVPSPTTVPNTTPTTVTNNYYVVPTQTSTPIPNNYQSNLEQQAYQILLDELNRPPEPTEQDPAIQECLSAKQVAKQPWLNDLQSKQGELANVRETETAISRQVGISAVNLERRIAARMVEISREIDWIQSKIREIEEQYPC